MLGLLAAARGQLCRPAPSPGARRFTRSYTMRGKTFNWSLGRGGPRESGFLLFREAMQKQNPKTPLLDISRRWSELSESERDTYNRRSSQSAPLLQRGKPIRELPPPPELAAAEAEMTVLKNTDVTTEAAIAVSSPHLLMNLAAAEEVAVDGVHDEKATRKALLATSWSKFSDAKISSMYRRAVGFLLFCLELKTLPRSRYKVDPLARALWIELAEDKRLEYIERGLKTKLESGVTLWEAVSVTGSPYRWRVLFMTIARQLKIKDYTGWYEVNMNQLAGLGAGDIIKRHYKGSHVKAITDLFPEHDFQPWKFEDNHADYWDKYEHRKRYMRWLASLLGIVDSSPASLEAWYEVTPAQIAALDTGSFIKEHYKGNLLTALRKYYPDHQWLEWKFPVVPRHFWTDVENRRRLFTWIGEQLRVSTMDDWYQISPTQVRARGGSTVLNKYYRDSLPEALKDVFPNHNWEDHRFKHVPTGYWDKVDNQRAYFDWFMRTYGMKTLDQWYSVKASDIPSSRVIAKYRHSLYDTLKSIYPHHPWDPTKFSSSTQQTTNTPPPWWKPEEETNADGNRKTIFPRSIHIGRRPGSTPKPKALNEEEASKLRQQLDPLLEQFSLPPQLESWYSLTKTQLKQSKELKPLLASFGGSLPRLLSTAYPTHPWKPWLFLHTPDDFWTDQQNQVEFLNWVKQELKLRGVSGFYKVTAQDIKDFGGGGLIKLFNESVYEMVKSAFPKFPWLPWKFAYLPQSTWKKDPDLAKQFFDYLGSRLSISSLDQWYLVSTNDVERAGGATLLELYGSLYDTFSAVFPDHKWQAWRFSKVSNGFWRKLDNQRQFFADVAAEVGIKSLEDWYKMTASQLSFSYGVDNLFEQYDEVNPLASALEACYPQHHWEVDRFASQPLIQLPTSAKPKGTSISRSFSDRFDRNDIEDEEELDEDVDDETGVADDEDDAEDPLILRVKYIKMLGRVLGVKKPSDWRAVTREQLKTAGEIDYLDAEGGLRKILSEVYPNEKFDQLEADKVANQPVPADLRRRQRKEAAGR